MKDLLAELKELHACREAIDWVATQESPQAAWESCERGDWMLWLLGKRINKTGSQQHRRLVRIACKCARLALPCVPDDDLQPLRAIELTERWAAGGAVSQETLRDVAEAVADAACAAAYAANATNAAYAAWAVADAACAAYAADAAINAANAAWAAANATNAAYAADAAINAAYAAGAHDSNTLDVKGAIRRCANIVREEVPVLADW